MIKPYFEKRLVTIKGIEAIGVRIASLVGGLAVIGFIFFLFGVNPIILYYDMLLTNIQLFSNTLTKFITLACIAIGLAIPFKARVDNIGAEGQYIVGTIAAMGTALLFPDLPSFILIPLMFINGFIFGAIWALPVVLFRAKGGFQGADVVVSFLMVFPALYLMEYLVSGPWRDPETGFTYSPILPPSAQIPSLSDIIPLQFFQYYTTVHITIFLVIIIAFLLYYYLFRTVDGIPKTKLGYEINVIGQNPLAGRLSGMSFFKIILISMILSGGLAGIAGVGEIAGNQLRLSPNSPGFGFTAIAVAYLGGLNPIGILISALFFAALIVGGTVINLSQLPETALGMFSGMIIFAVLLAEFFLKFTIKWRRN